MKFPDASGLPVSVPLEVSDTADANEVTVLLFTSWAVMRMLNGVPAIWAGMAPPPEASTLKWSSAPATTLKVMGLPPSAVKPVDVAVTVTEPATPPVSVLVATPLAAVLEPVPVTLPAPAV